MTVALLAAVGAVVVGTTRRRTSTSLISDTSPVLSRAGLVSAAGNARAAAASPSPSPPQQVPRELPRGGRVLLPTYRLVGFCGLPGANELGRLGVGDLDARVIELMQTGSLYAGAGADGAEPGTDGRRLLPVLELIVVVAQHQGGDDGKFRVRVGDDVVAAHLAAARRHRALLLLNIQPGRAAFIDEVRAYEKWLVEPEVGVALDPEWSVTAPVVPGQFFGHVSGAELDDVAVYLAGLVKAHDLPEKAMVVHQLAPSVIRDSAGLQHHNGVVVIKSVDGIGSPTAKSDTWAQLVTDLPAGMKTGFKIFFTEDRGAGSVLMSPRQVLSLRPQPDYVMYE